MSNEYLTVILDALESNDFYISSSIGADGKRVAAKTLQGSVYFEVSEARVLASFEKNDVDVEWRDLVTSGLSVSMILNEATLELFDHQGVLVSNIDSCVRMDVLSGLTRLAEKTDLTSASDAVMKAVQIIMTDMATHQSYIEGRETTFISKRYERSPAIRSKAIALYGLDCNVCGFNFRESYGDLGDGFIHIHHIERVSDSGIRAIDITRDVLAVCPNCHAMLHKKTPPLHPDELKRMLKRKIEND